MKATLLLLLAAGTLVAIGACVLISELYGQALDVLP